MTILFLLLGGYATPYRLHGNSNGGGILVFICEDIPAGFEGFFIELNLRKRKWLVDNTHKKKISNHLTFISKMLDLFSKEQILLISDFNTEKYDKPKDEFCKMYNL